MARIAARLDRIEAALEAAGIELAELPAGEETAVIEQPADDQSSGTDESTPVQVDAEQTGQTETATDPAAGEAETRPAAATAADPPAE